jgi:hypothetical protein
MRSLHGRDTGRLGEFQGQRGTLDLDGSLSLLRYGGAWSSFVATVLIVWLAVQGLANALCYGYDRRQMPQERSHPLTFEREAVLGGAYSKVFSRGNHFIQMCLP